MVGRYLDDLSGQEFGIWKVLEFDHERWYGRKGTSGCTYYRCQCKKCGKIFIRSRKQLLQCKNIRHCGRCEHV